VRGVVCSWCVGCFVCFSWAVFVWVGNCVRSGMPVCWVSALAILSYINFKVVAFTCPSWKHICCHKLKCAHLAVLCCNLDALVLWAGFGLSCFGLSIHRLGDIDSSTCRRIPWDFPPCEVFGASTFLPIDRPSIYLFGPRTDPSTIASFHVPFYSFKYHVGLETHRLTDSPACRLVDEAAHRDILSFPQLLSSELGPKTVRSQQDLDLAGGSAPKHGGAERS